jgi:hypothetical protein
MWAWTICTGLGGKRNNFMTPQQSRI